MSRRSEQNDELDGDGQAATGGGAPETESAPAVAPGADAQAAELKDKWLRALAEIDNVRRASRHESEQVRKYGSTPLLLSLLPVLDNLQRALAAPPADIDPDYLAGLQLTERQFLDALAAHGVQPVPAQKGTRFDPAVHRALLEQASDEVEAGTILTAVQPGYMLNDRLLREAQVVVARAPSGGRAR